MYQPRDGHQTTGPDQGFGGDVWIGVFVVLRVDGAACGARQAGVVLSVLW